MNDDDFIVQLGACSEDGAGRKLRNFLRVVYMPSGKERVIIGQENFRGNDQARLIDELKQEIAAETKARRAY